MTRTLRILTDKGVASFSKWITSGATGRPPVAMLDDIEHSTAFEGMLHPDRQEFADKVEFAAYLNEILDGVEPERYHNNVAFWATLGLIWFDQLRRTGSKPGALDRYVIHDPRKAHRHLVRSAWLVYRDHGEHARFMLLSPKKSNRPLSILSDAIDHLTARQRIISSKVVIQAACKLYTNPVTGRPWDRSTGRTGAGVRRFAFIIKQLDMTIDPESMTVDNFIAALPKEFEFWREKLAAAQEEADLAA